MAESLLIILMQTLMYIGYAFAIFTLLLLITLPVIYIIDRRQTVSTIRRNYPIIGRFRYFFEFLGEFFRQYFFAQDREELPFNRAIRSWVYRSAKNIDSTVAFGSTRDLTKPGSIFFINSPFPILESDIIEPKPVTIGPYSKKPYSTTSIFNISGMSYGALSSPAIKALSKGAKMSGIWLNTGEGGLSPYHLEGGCDLVFQIGTAKFGVRDKEGKLNDDKLRQVASHEQVKMFEIKLSQGAKPGKGGILPGAKVTQEIAEIRGLYVGQDAISPNRHPDISNNSDLLNMVNHIRDLTGKPVGFKAVMGSTDWIEDLCKEIVKRGEVSAPDFITIDSSEGGTGAAPMSLIDNVGLSIKESLPRVIDILKAYKLRDRIKINASGKLVNPLEVAWAFCAGADFVYTARGFMFALGCIQSLKCNKNTCPTGIATHNPKLQYGLNPQDKAVRVAHYAKNMVKEINMIAHSCGVHHPRELERYHARIVLDNGKSMGYEELYPEVK